MSALVGDGVADSREPIEDHSAGAAFNIVDGGAAEGEDEGGRDGEAVERSKGVGSHGEGGKAGCSGFEDGRGCVCLRRR